MNYNTVQTVGWITDVYIVCLKPFMQMLYWISGLCMSISIIVNGISQHSLIHCCKGWKHTHHGQSHSSSHRSQEHSHRCNSLLDPTWKIRESVQLQTMKMLWLVCSIIQYRSCLICSPCSFHHSCRDWRHNHRCLSGKWFQSILAHMHNCSLQLDPKIEVHVNHGT